MFHFLLDLIEANENLTENAVQVNKQMGHLVSECLVMS